MMKSLLSARALSLLATAAVAQVGPPTSQRPCSANRQLVMRDGAVVLDTSPNSYARFVRSGAECLVGSSRNRHGCQARTIRNASSAIGAETAPTTFDEVTASTH